MMKSTIKLAAATACAFWAGSALAEEVSLPGTVAWTAYDLGSTGYNQAVAIGAALKDAYGVNLRILPGKNDISRTEPLRQGKVDFSANGIGGVYMAQEGVLEFAAKNWGPQPSRLALMNNAGEFSITIGVTREVCETVGKPGCEGFTYADLRGRKVARVTGAPGINLTTEAILAYAGLTWDDVDVVDFGGYGDSVKGMGSGLTEAVYLSTTAGASYEQAANPRGLFWPSIDPNDAEALARTNAVAPYLAPSLITVGAGLEGTAGIYNFSYPYPMLETLADKDEALVYSMTRAMIEQYDAYADKSPGNNGWALRHQKFDWLVPYHDGAIRYYREIGVWTDAHQAHNDGLVQRQKVLADAWAALEQENPADWTAAWAERRREALRAAGMPAPF